MCEIVKYVYYLTVYFETEKYVLHFVFFSDRIYVKGRTTGGLTLYFTQVLDDDSGNYRCTADVNDNTLERVFVLLIRGKFEYTVFVLSVRLYVCRES